MISQPLSQTISTQVSCDPRSLSLNQKPTHKLHKQHHHGIPLLGTTRFEAQPSIVPAVSVAVAVAPVALVAIVIVISLLLSKLTLKLTRHAGFDFGFTLGFHVFGHIFFVARRFKLV
ncbi:hypothetical protein QBC45DRAFT_403267 [Copromyces sp. CBS 386.78]|nr:hypothetical protein QBC45DRAFT_403267 [Copromyces sp. CBS 386.78]